MDWIWGILALTSSKQEAPKCQQVFVFCTLSVYFSTNFDEYIIPLFYMLTDFMVYIVIQIYEVIMGLLSFILCLIMIRFFELLISHASFKYILPSSNGVWDRKIKGSLKFILSLNLHSVFFHKIHFEILLSGIFQKNCCNSYLIWEKREPKWTKF